MEEIPRPLWPFGKGQEVALSAQRAEDSKSFVQGGLKCNRLGCHWGPLRSTRPRLGLIGAQLLGRDAIVNRPATFFQSRPIQLKSQVFTGAPCSDIRPGKGLKVHFGTAIFRDLSLLATLVDFASRGWQSWPPPAARQGGHSWPSNLRHSADLALARA